MGNFSVAALLEIVRCILPFFTTASLFAFRTAIFILFQFFFFPFAFETKDQKGQLLKTISQIMK